MSLNFQKAVICTDINVAAVTESTTHNRYSGVAFIIVVRGYMRKDPRLSTADCGSMGKFFCIVTKHLMFPWKSLYKSVFIFTYIFQIFCKEEEDLLVDSDVYSGFKGRKNSQPLSKKPLSSVEVVMVM